MATSARYLVFVEERFPPGAYLPLICAFTAAGYLPSIAWSGTAVQPLRFIAAAVVVGLVFLHLRLIDEVKDAEVDRLGRPARPLPRGLVTERELTRAAIAALLLALAAALSLTGVALVALLPATVFVLLADVEFLAPRRVHRDLLVYALAHSTVVPSLMVFAWFADSAAQPSPALPGLVLLAWGVGLGLEFARKTYGPDEERAFVETYSSALGRESAGWLAAGSLAVAMIGGALYAWLAGAGPTVALVAVVASGLILAAGVRLGRANHRTVEGLGTLIGLAVLLWPIGVAIVVGGSGR
ncbi:MAG: UbiA family prenyltransferase [Chloroflexi bacterium]|nr:UbiA family prenyltransferase [Chloroflexota bacterium]